MAYFSQGQGEDKKEETDSFQFSFLYWQEYKGYFREWQTKIQLSLGSLAEQKLFQKLFIQYWTREMAQVVK